MALQAERAHIGEVAFAAAFDDGDDVIGIPEMPAEAPFSFELPAGFEIEFAFIAAERFGVDAALGADAAVARENLLTKIAGVGPQPPFVDAGGTTEGEPAAGNFRAAAAAEAAPAIDPTAGLNAAGAHTRSS